MAQGTHGFSNLNINQLRHLTDWLIREGYRIIAITPFWDGAMSSGFIVLNKPLTKKMAGQLLDWNDEIVHRQGVALSRREPKGLPVLIETAPDGGLRVKTT